MPFNGSTYQPDLDRTRLKGQLSRVEYLMQDRNWHTLREIADFAGGSEAGVSARIRDLKKEKFGGHTVNKRRIADSGLWEYQVLKPGQLL